MNGICTRVARGKGAIVAAVARGVRLIPGSVKIGLFLRQGRTSVHAVNVRQLKSNPSVALREARNDLVVVMNRDTPDAVLVGMEQLGIADLPHVRRALAVALFRGGDISAATAAKVAQVPLAEMLGQLSALGISLHGGTAAEAVQEVDIGAQWLAPAN